MEASSTQEALSGQKGLSRWGHPLHKRPYLGRRRIWMGASSTQEALSGQKASGWGPPLHGLLSGQKDLCEWGPPLLKRPYLGGGRRPSLDGGSLYARVPI